VITRALQTDRGGPGHDDHHDDGHGGWH